jgi:ubiquinone/menaquinone biosynthesis C-methylase UbiE
MSQRQHSKIEYYSDPGVVERYESWRFGSAGGRHAGRREIDAVLRHTSQLPRQAGILDMPIGTGRLSSALLDAGFDNVYGCDSSESMLATAALVCGDRVSYTRGDAFTTGFADSSFDAVISLRFFFHYRDTRALIAEMARVLKPDGLLIFDTLRWSPRSSVARVQRVLGGSVYPQSDSAVTAALAAEGFVVEQCDRLLLLPSLAYRFVPGFLLPGLDRLEDAAPSGLRSKSLWSARKRSQT